nr:ankyrin repeat protein [Cedratvirus borely]
MDVVYKTIFSFCGGYNFLNGQVCRRFRFIVPRTKPSSYLNQLIADGKTPENFKPSRRLMQVALERNLFSLLQECRKYGPCGAYEASLETGNMEMLQWAVTNGYYYCDKEKLCYLAARSGDLPALQYLRANGYHWDESICSIAVGRSHLEVLRWARANGCPWNESTFREAARVGNLEVLKWLKANACPWDKWACTAAANSGHLGILVWLAVNGCSWDENTFSYAIRDTAVARISFATWCITQK